MSAQRQKGFTLIELLIASALLSLILFLGSYGYSLLANRWDKSLGHFASAIVNIKHLEQLRRVISTTIPVIVTREDDSYSFYLQGENDQLRAAAVSGIEHAGAVYYQLSLTPDDAAPDLFDLTYQEIPADEQFIGTPKVVSYQHRVTLMHNVKSMSIHYLGWNSINEKNLSNMGENSKTTTWHNSYDAIATHLFPTDIKVDIEYLTADGQSQFVSFMGHYDHVPEKMLNSGDGQQ